ncbi:MAG TPA: hypothetical protein VMW65_13895 [Chloroflexota bacterium]|nr:hypothetical protein [Chloroflexota bacterium]
MVAPRSQQYAHTRLLEAGNLIFLYRPRPGVIHPRSSTDIAQTAITLLPDNQTQHPNRLFIFPSCVFPPIVEGQNLPEEQGFAYTSAVSVQPRQLIEAVEQDTPVPPSPTGPPAPTPARVVGAGRYVIALQNSETYLAYALGQPSQLGAAQQTVLLDQCGVFKMRVLEPALPTPVTVAGSPDYPHDLGDRFDGHVSIPADPVQLLDYQWTRIVLFGQTTNLQGFGVSVDPTVENQSSRHAFQQLDRDRGPIESLYQVDICKPMETGELE